MQRQHTTTKITLPGNGVITALDPCIPLNRQRLYFTAECQNLTWQLDGKTLACGQSVQWLPWPGKPVRRLTDSKSALLDKIRLEVRCAGLKAGSGSAASK